ncbi:ABC transporter permease subunit [Lactobacillus sp. S2-2]|uniref:ABC transporter substrate-binding protein/permease n=1 Tax=Lactobacillus sp. S2-2 TaxID=2692917 RepID=UPI001F4125AB|nr:ABC transporter substrate-binding protein/permease [Lactobacillus sp. S2-2]MCF6515602.1 ABC transporter permease subunit [Lactobacillus sp. S2-2]
MKKFNFKIIGIILLMMGVIGTYQTVSANSDTSLQKVQQKGEIVMGTAADYPPFEFTKNINGKSGIYGADILLGQKIAKDLGVKLSVKPMSFDSLLVGLQTGKVDMVLAGMGNTPERKKSVNFSKDYYDDPNVLISLKETPHYKNKKDLTGKVVGAQTGSIPFNLIKKQKQVKKVMGMESNNDLIIALQSHKVDAIVLDKATAQAFIQNNDALKIDESKFLDSGSKMAIAMQKHSNSLTNAVNKTVNNVNKHDLYNKEFLPAAGAVLNGPKKGKGPHGPKHNQGNPNSMWNYKGYFISGMIYTIVISLIATFFGFIIGTALALLRMVKNKLIKGTVIGFVEFIRGTPLMIQIMFVYFGIGVFVNIPAVFAGIIAISINSGAYVAEIIRSGIDSIDTGQTEASRSLGMSKKNTMRFIILPQALKNIWPALGNEFVSLIKESSIVSIIGVTDLIYQLKIVQSDTYRGVMPIFVSMILYFVMTFTASTIMKVIERKMSHD